VSFRARLVSGIAVTLALVALGLWRLWPHAGAQQDAGHEVRSSAEALNALEGSTGWLNGPSVPLDSLRGRVVALVLWSDTDPLSARVLAEAEAWRQAYEPLGARIIGVHVPDYVFAADTAVAAVAARRAGASFPIAQDGDYRIASRLGAGDALPLVVVATPDGRGVVTIHGDALDRAHRAIRDALRRARPDLGLAPDPAPPAAAAAPPVKRVFCGTSRVVRGPLAASVPGKTVTFTAEFRYQVEGEPYTPYVVGRWTPNAEGVIAARGGAAEFLAVRSQGGDAYAVLGPSPAERGRVWILSDDRWLAEAERGADVRADARGATYVDVTESRLYAIARGTRPCVFKLSPDQPGVTIYELSFVSR
jgi:hypothetical protein